MGVDLPPADSLAERQSRPLLSRPFLPEDTIVALSTPAGRGGLGVVRLSGSDAVGISERLIRLDPGSGKQFPKSHRAAVAELVDQDGGAVDQIVVTFFQKPRSYTAEDVVELSCHGSPVVLALAIERAIELGARLAEPGEFTQRAFLNGRIDLAQAEAVRDLIEATTLYQARVAVQQVEGSLSRRLSPIKKQLCDLIALLEAGIDFAEDDISIASGAEILSRLRPVIEGVRKLADSFRFGKVVRSGLTLAILGRPNVGKSSLFNRLLEQERAIVTELPGTTRDAVSEVVSIRGLPVKLIDTAGIRPARDAVESMGVERSYEALADADLILVVIDLSEELTSTDKEILSKARERGRSLLVGNKSDLPAKARPGEEVPRVSALTGEGISQLRERIYEAVVPAGGELQEGGFITNIRHETLLKESLAQLRKAETAVDAAVPHEMLLLDLYGALRPIDHVTGATTVEDILGNIFSTFCIGK